MDLIQRALCEDPSNYENLLSNLAIAKNILDCTADGKILIDQPGAQILLDMFKDTNDVDKGFWNDSFKERNVYYYNKECDYLIQVWKPKTNTCDMDALNLTCNPQDMTFVQNGGTGSASITVVTQGNSTIPEATTVTITGNMTGNEYFVLWSQCTFTKYAFYFGVNPSTLDLSIDVAIPVTIGVSTTVTATNLITAIDAQVAFSALDGGSSQLDITHIVNTPTSFKEIAESLTLWLGHIDSNTLLENVQKIITSLSNIIIQRATVDRIMRKTWITVGTCDL
jgi:hypothetical protein